MDYAVLLLVPETADAIKILSDLNYKLFNVTNQNAKETTTPQRQSLR